jgi:hypothetical protein
MTTKMDSNTKTPELYATEPKNDHLDNNGEQAPIHQVEDSQKTALEVSQCFITSIYLWLLN